MHAYAAFYSITLFHVSHRNCCKKFLQFLALLCLLYGLQGMPSEQALLLHWWKAEPCKTACSLLQLLVLWQCLEWEQCRACPPAQKSINSLQRSETPPPYIQARQHRALMTMEHCIRISSRRTVQARMLLFVQLIGERSSAHLKAAASVAGLWLKLVVALVSAPPRARTNLPLVSIP